MKTRDAVLDYQKTMKDTETYEKDLDLTEPISALDFELECTNGSLGNKGNYLSDICTKVEISDGSDILTNLNFSQLQALQFYKTHKAPAMYFSEHASGTQRGGARLLFGRELWDPLFGLDASKYKNPKLRVTFNKAAIRAASTSGFATGDNIKLTVVAKVFENAARPSKFLMQKQIESFTAAASGEKRIELPTDYTYRMMMLRLYLAAWDVDLVCTNAKLTFDTDKFIAFDRKTKQLDREAEEFFGSITWEHNIYQQHDQSVRTVINKEPRIVPVNTSLGHIAGSCWAWGGLYNLGLCDHAGNAITTDEDVWTLQMGHALHSTLPILFGRPDIPEEWLNPTAFKKAELVLTQANSTATAVCEIVLEQVRPQ